MALYPPPDKLIFAPSPDTPTGGVVATTPAANGSTAAPSAAPPQAGQFLKHESDGGLRRSDLDARGPISQFHTWFGDARTAGIAHPEACTLSTASLPSGRVSARMVYLKELDPQGFVLYSNFGTSQKAKDLFGDDAQGSTGNKWASLTFFWEAQERQVRVEGLASRLPPDESQVYYDTRVRGSRIGAWASRQSAELKPGAAKNSPEGDDGRAQLEEWVQEAKERFGEDESTKQIPIPPFWGGLRIVPERIEFWQGRQNRLHDRFVFDRAEGKDDKKEMAWTVKRLSP